MGAGRHTVTCYRCARSEARRPDDGLPTGWASAVVAIGADGQQVVYVCPSCDLPAATLNRQPQTRRHP